MSADAVGERISHLLRDVPDFPKPGILFKDVSPVYADAVALQTAADALAAAAPDAELVAGVEARGFVLAAAVAGRLDAGVVMVRKAGKLPPPTLHRSYELEYGSAELELPVDIVAGKRVLLVDDVLATGGTLRAAAELIVEGGGTLAALAVLLEIAALGGRAQLSGLPDVYAVLQT